jgi:hypothetical protein
MHRANRLVMPTLTHLKPHPRAKSVPRRPSFGIKARSATTRPVGINPARVADANAEEAALINAIARAAAASLAT